MGLRFHILGGHALSSRYPTIVRSGCGALLAALALTAGCAPRFSKQHVRTYEELLPGRVRAMPAWHWLDAEVKLDGDAAVVHVVAQQACTRRLIDETSTETEQAERPSGGGIALDILLPVGVLIYPFFFYPPILAIPLAGGAIAMGLDLSSRSTESFHAVTRQGAGVTPARCEGELKARPERVELSLEDGTRLDARLDARGRARIAIPASLWAGHDNRLDFDVRVDGILVARAVLEHTP